MFANPTPFVYSNIPQDCGSETKMYLFGIDQMKPSKSQASF